jgi:hypothetical protein
MHERAKAVFLAIVGDSVGRMGGRCETTDVLQQKSDRRYVHLSLDDDPYVDFDVCFLRIIVENFLRHSLLIRIIKLDENLEGADALGVRLTAKLEFYDR